MKTVRMLLMAAVLVFGLGAGAAFAQDIEVVNATGFTIQQLGLADSNASGDAQDLLGDNTLPNGQSIVIEVTGGSKGWELIATDGQGGQVNWPNLDLTGVSRVTIHADGTANLQ